MPRQRFFLLVLIPACWFWPTPSFAQPEPTRLPITYKDIDGSLEDEWFGMYFQGAKIGYVNSKRTAEKEEIPTKDDKIQVVTFYREKLVMSMKLQSAGQKSELKIEQTLDFEGKPPFRLIRADYAHTNEKIVQRITLAAQGPEKDYEAVLVVGTVEQKKKISNLDYTLADSLATELWVKRKAAKGAEITTRELEMDHLKVDLVTTTMLDNKETLVNGVKMVFYETKSINHKSNIVSESKYDDKGRLLSGTVAGTFEMRREKAEDAKNTEYSADLFLMGMAKIDKGLGQDTSKLTGLILEIKGKELAALPEGPRQTLVAKGNEVFHLRLGKKYGNQAKATDKEIKEALEETVVYPISDAKVKEMAVKAGGDAKTDEDKAKSICKFVHDFIEPSLSATVPRMHDLMVRKSGDCKSYALMFTCLARAAGLPSREVSGFVYMGDDVKSFGGHAWNEVLLGGSWVPVDASMNQVDADPTHICLGTENESANNLLKTFGKLHFKLVDVERSK